MIFCHNTEPRHEVAAEKGREWSAVVDHARAGKNEREGKPGPKQKITQLRPLGMLRDQRSPSGGCMGLFSSLFGSTRTYRMEGCSVGIIKLPKPVRTTLASNVRNIYCTVDIDYKIKGEGFKIIRVKLGRRYSGSMPLNVMSSHTGEAWYANSELRRYLNNKVLPRVIDQLVRQDSQLQEWLRENAGIYAPATGKQRALAERRGWQLEKGITKTGDELSHWATVCRNRQTESLCQATWNPIRRFDKQTRYWRVNRPEAR